MLQGRIHVNKTIDLLYRLRLGHSQRRINRETGISRKTIRKYFSLAQREGWLLESVPLPSIDEVGRALAKEDDKLISEYSPPLLAPYRKVVTDWLTAKYTRKRMLVLLRENYGVQVSYDTLKKYCRKLLNDPATLVTMRMETPPGKEAQIDFGEVTRCYRNLPLNTRVWVFIMTLGCSRHMYVEHVFDQKMETWLRCHENAFRFFGGVVEKVVIDNLKAAVKKLLFHDPVLSEPYKRLARHYGFIISPCRPYTPEHKGKVESNVGYVRRNLCDGASWTNLSDMNRKARTWVLEEAGERTHGTIRQKPLEVFREVERKTLRKLPARPLNHTTASQQKLPRDIHVQIGENRYSAPHEYIDHTLDVYAEGKLVKIYRDSELIATHPRSSGTGQHITCMDHYPHQKRWWIENNAEVCIEKAGRIGESCLELVTHLLSDDVQDRLSSVHKLLGLCSSSDPERLEKACARAIHYGEWSYIRVKTILANGMESVPIERDEYIPVKETGYDHARQIGGVL